MRINGVSQDKALEIIKERQKRVFVDFKDLRTRVKGIFKEQDGRLIEF